MELAGSAARCRHRTHTAAKPHRLPSPREHQYGLDPRVATHRLLANSRALVGGFRTPALDEQRASENADSDGTLRLPASRCCANRSGAVRGGLLSGTAAAARLRGGRLPH